MKSRTSLRFRLVMLVLVAILPLFGLSVVKAVISTDSAIVAATKNLELAASLVAANLDSIAESARQVLVAVASRKEAADWEKDKCQEYFKTLKAQLQGYGNIGVVGADGYIRCHSLPNTPPGFAGDRAYFQGAIAQNGFVSGGYLLGRFSKKPVITFSLPLPAFSGGPGAVVFSTLYLTEVSRVVADVTLPQSSRLLVLDREDIVLAANPEAPAAIGRQVESQILQAAVKGSSQGILEGLDASGIEQIYAFVPSNKAAKSALFVAVSAKRSDMVAPARRQLQLEFLVLSVVAFLGGWGAWKLGGTTIVSPTADILDATRKMQSGRLDARIPLRRNISSEFASIAEGINRMADSLEQRELDLATELAHSQQANTELAALQDAQARSYDELRETQRKLVDAHRLGRIGHWELDMREARLTWSDELHVLFGLEPGSFDGRHETFMEMMHPDDRVRYDQYREAAHRDGTTLNIEYRIVTPKGDVRWMHQAGIINIGEADRLTRRNGVIQDITQRKQSELALAQSNTQLRRTGDMARVGGWDVDLVTRDASWSDEFMLIHELEPGARMTVKEAISFYAPDAQAVFNAAVSAALKEALPWDLELPLITAKGRHVWVRTQGRPVLEGNRVVAIGGALQDITVQHASREHLRLLETSISRLNDIVLITDAEPLDEPGPRIVYVNDAFEQRTGYTREEVLGKSPRLLQGLNTQQAELRRLGASLKAFQPVRAELINYKKSGEEFWIELDIVPIADGKGCFTHWVSVARDITDRKLAERALVESEQRYAALFDSAPVPMWVHDAVDNRFLTINRVALKDYGYSAEEFLGMKLFDIRSAASHEALRKPTDGGTEEEIWLHRRKDGSTFPVSVVSAPIQYAGRAARFVVAVDVSAQFKAEKEVQDYLFTLQRAADAAQAITWHQTLEGMLHEVAEQARGVIGAHQAVVSLTVGGNWAQSVNALSTSEKYSEYRDMFEAPDGSGIYALVCETNRLIRMTQAELEAHPRWNGFGKHSGKHPAMQGWLAVPLTGRSGKNIGLLQLSDKYEGEFTLQDEYVAIELAQLAAIAIENAQLLEEVNQLNAGLEQKVAERTVALAQQEALFRALSEQAPQVVWTANLKGEGTYFNRAWYELVGGSVDDWKGNKWSAAIHPEDLPGVSAHWKLAATSRAPFVGIRRIRATDGSYHTMSYRASPVLDDFGEVAFWVGIDADITEIKTIEAALRLSNQELEAFSYSVSHDLRSPLNTIDGFSRLLAKQMNKNMEAKGQHYLARIQAGVAQMGKLIEDLLSLAQVSRTQLHSEAVDLTVCSNQILDEWRARQPERRVEFIVEHGLIAQADGRLVKIVLENLLSNAWKFTSQKASGCISVGKKADASGLPVFFVTDNGAGFDMAYADKLFIAFQRLHTASEFPGTGVGLATVSRVVARHGGKLWAQASPGEGASFFFTLPAPRASS